jgi:hypothetical protein
MKKIKIIGMVLLFSILLGVAAALHYILPKYAVVTVNGVEVKRMDANGLINAQNPAQGTNRDIYFINTGEPDNPIDVSVFRNEDTGFGFPWYFKFNATDVQARAQQLSTVENQLALIKYYGWRLRMISKFPNMVSIEATDSRSEPFPFFNVVFFLILFFLVGFTYWKIETRRRKKQTAQ